MVALKLLPHLLSWFGIVVLLLRSFSGRRQVVIITAIIGFITGAIATFLMIRSLPGTTPFGVVKSGLGVSFLLLWGIAVAAGYQNSGRGKSLVIGGRISSSPLWVGAIATVASLVAGGVSVCKVPDIATSYSMLLALAFVVCVLAVAYVARFAEKRLTGSFQVSQLGMSVAVVALLLFSSSSILRLDLFSPLSMKVMKGIHDFVHQFMESILIPDHAFVRPVIWKYIGLLFGKGVGFWGGLIIWFTPALLIVVAVASERLPLVAHIRQGAQRRRVMAEALKLRRQRLVVPLLSVVVFSGAAYQSSFPSVEYWDPKPIQVTANQAGEISIPKKGELSLEDGKLHKYLYKQGEKEVRFFVLMTPAGELTVDLDACAICKPDGYGQAEGSVICYYCKTLIPLETVGKPGGCNPVPVVFADKGDSVVINGMTLVNSWSATVQATARVKEGGK